MSLLLFIAFSVVACIVAVAWRLRLGAYVSPRPSEVNLGPFILLYKEVVGPYKDIGSHFYSLMETVAGIGLVHNVHDPTVMRVGIYYDDPKCIPADQCRTACAFVFKHGKDLATPRDVQKYRDWLHALSVVKAGELKVGYFPACRCLALKGPLVSMTASIMLAVLTFYPALERAYKKLIADQKAGKATPGVGPVSDQFQGALEVYAPRGPSDKYGTMWVAYPLQLRKELLPFQRSNDTKKDR